MRRAIYKDFFREIKYTLNRYLSILFIVALGVAFFAGIRATSPDMKLTLDHYLDETGYMDIRVLSTMGLTDEDITALSEIEGVALVEPSYYYDAYVVRGDERRTLRFLPEPDQINRMEIIDGREIQADNECVVDEFLVEKFGYSIGDTLTVMSADEDEAVSDTLSEDTYTIVGVATSSSYFTLTRDSTSIGNGSTDAFVYLKKDVFLTDIYTVAYILVSGASDEVAFSDKYEAVVEAVTDRIDAISEEREAARYNDIMADANEELDKARQELADAKEEAESELSDAWTQIEDGQKELDEGYQTLADNRSDYETQIADAKAKIASGEEELADGQAQISANEKKLADGQKQIEEAEATLKTSKEELEKNKTAYEEGLAQAQAGQEQLDAGYEQLTEAAEMLVLQESTLIEQKTALQSQKTQIEAAIAASEGSSPELSEQLKQVEAGLAQVETGLAQIEAGMDELDAQKLALDAQQQQLDATFQQLSEAKQQLDEGESQLAAGEEELAAKKKELASGKASLEAAKDKISTGTAEIDSSKQQLSEKMTEAEAQFADAEAELADGETTLAKAREDYQTGKEEADQKIADAEAEIKDAEDKLADVDYPEWYVLDRNSTQGYVEYEQNAERIGAIGRVFPLIFFLVAALISLTTMTRMVESQRTQIGTLKALGYGKWDIARKYVLYALSASAIGSAIGLVFGQKFLPWLIITTYKVLYPNLPVVLTPLSLRYSIMSSAVAILCVTVAALAACYKELIASAAELMRPVAPKVGRKIWLEYIGFIWKRLRFTAKVAMRNLFRYKKRFFMTIFGIGGCTALVIFGFGLTDSISGVVDRQYETLFHYDLTVSLEENSSDQEMQELADYLTANEDVEEYIRVRSKSLEIQGESTSYLAYLTVPEDTDAYKAFVVLQDRASGVPYELDDETVIITEKLAELLGLKEGDAISIKDNDVEKQVTVGHIAENYILSYIYMSPTLYTKTFGEAPKWNAIQAFVPDLTEEETESISEELLSLDAVTGTTTTAHTREKFDDVLGSLDVITLVVIVAAGMLAFIVLYNLNNINITERRRELATLKVLGFHSLEVAEYVYRENVMLTLIGALLGLVFGRYLHAYIITTVETDILMFIRSAKATSYVWAVLITFGFSMFVNWMMYYRVRKIDMVESLKSVE